MVKTKLVSVFASKITPDLDSLTLSEYLKEKLRRDVACQKIKTVQSRYSSFKVSAECNEISEMYETLLFVMSRVRWESAGQILHQLLGKVCALG